MTPATGFALVVLILAAFALALFVATRHRNY